MGIRSSTVSSQRRPYSSGGCQVKLGMLGRVCINLKRVGTHNGTKSVWKAKNRVGEQEPWNCDLASSHGSLEALVLFD